MATGILNKIVSEKRQEVEQRKRGLPTAALKERIAGRGAPLDFKRALGGESIKLIAEVKKASPSRGILCPDFDPLAIARSYVKGGATAISVLTEEKHFQGSLEHLKSIREEISLPLLRKDFIFDEYQIYESVAYGADALLLIAAILSREQLKELLGLSLSLGTRCLVEVHNEKELERALTADAEIIGINNRDLNTFKANIDITRRLCSLIPSDKVVVSESGIRSRYDIVKLKKWGVNAVLVGESLVTAVNIPVKIKELLQ